MSLRTLCVASAILWSVVAVVAATHQWAQLAGSGKELSWLRAMGWQGASWLLLVPVTPLLAMSLRRAPLEREHPRRLLLHVVASLLFALLFLLVSVPLRLSFHPSPLRWSFFGEAFYKSMPQFMLVGMFTYWAVVVVASLVDARVRLRGVLEAATGDASDVEASAARLILTTPAGKTTLLPDDIAWVEPDAPGARLHTSRGEVLVRHTLSELEELLAARGFVRSHRSCLVNSAHITELIGGASRDGLVRLDTDETLPVTRRRRAAVEAMLAAAPGAPLAS